MSVSRQIRVVPDNTWRLPGCSPNCWPRRHDPAAHEEYGYQQGRRDRRETTIVRSGPLVIDLSDHRITVDGAEVALSQREWQIVTHLAQRAGAFSPTKEIATDVWGQSILARAPYLNGNGGRVDAAFRLINVNVERIRRKLGPAGPLIESVRRQGYRLRMPLVEATP